MKLKMIGLLASVCLFTAVSCNFSIGESAEDIKEKYGEKVVQDEDEVFYKDGETKEEAERVMKFLVDNAIFGKNGTKQSAQVVIEGDVHIVKIVKGSAMGDVDEIPESTVNTLLQIKSLIEQNVFPGEKVALHLTDDEFGTLRAF